MGRKSGQSVEPSVSKPKRKRIITPGNLAVALIGFLFLACLSVTAVVHLRQIYYFDINYLHIADDTGLDPEVIQKNYDVLIDYNLINKQVEDLEFPDFPMSEHGRIHFEEVKRIFVWIQYGCIVFGALLFFSLVRKLYQKDYGSFKLISVFSLWIPILLGILVAVNWERFFVQFHELFFNNDYWLFDPVKDPIITILPDSFFLHCAVAILLILVAGCIIFNLIYQILTRKYRK